MILWGKVRMIKDPNTGKRVSLPRPESKRHYAEIPELEIVPPALFDAEQAQLEARSKPGGTRQAAAAPAPPIRPYQVRSLWPRHVCGGCGQE